MGGTARRSGQPAVPTTPRIRLFRKKIQEVGLILPGRNTTPFVDNAAMQTPAYNPYAAPDDPIDSDVPFTNPNDDLVILASRMSRLGAALLDGIFGAVVVMIVGVIAGVSIKSLRVDPSNFVWALLPAILMVAAVQLYFLTKGQSVGKRLVGIRIVDVHTNHVPSLGRLIGLRWLLIGVLQNIPYIGSFLGLANILFIFGRERRCLHDYLASTKVIAANSGPYLT